MTYIEREAFLRLISILPSSPITEREDRLINAFISVVKTFPAADVRSVVRCKNCRHRDPEDHKCDCGQLERVGCVFPVDDDYFCAYGEES